VKQTSAHPVQVVLLQNGLDERLRLVFGNFGAIAQELVWDDAEKAKPGQQLSKQAQKETN
jgi:hypothetical protein